MSVQPQTSHTPQTAAPKKDRLDWVIASVCISAGLIGLRTVNDPQLWSDLMSRGASASRPIGKLIKKKGGVRRRTAVSPLWHDVYAQAEDVSAGDTVFTGDDGYAELVLDDGSRAQIDPGSLIVVARGVDVMPDKKGWLKSGLSNFFAVSKTQSVIKIEKGSARVDLKKDAPALKLQVRGKVYDVAHKGDGGSVELTADHGPGGGVRLTSLNGGGVELSEVSPTDDGAAPEQKAVALAQGQQAAIGAVAAPGAKAEAAISVQKIVLTPINPLPGQQLSGDGTLLFEWQGQGDVPLVLEVTQANGQSVHEAAVQAQDLRHSLQFGNGSYRWRLRSTDSARPAQTAWRAFSFTQLAPPRPLGPLGGARISLAKGKKQSAITFTWRRAQGSTLPTELEWVPVKREDGEQNAAGHLQRVDTDGVTISFVPGEYQWRIRARAVEGDQASEWTEGQRFTVGEPPEETTAAATSAPAAGTGLVVGTPGTVAAPVAPPVAVAPPPVAAIPEPVVAAKKLAPVAPPPKPKPKAPRVLTVTGTKAATQLGSAERLDQIVVPLQWKKLEDAKSYEVRVSELITGKKLFEATSDVPSVNWVLKSLEATQFNYQVTAIMDTGEKVASAPVPIQIQMSAPVPKTPSDGAQVSHAAQQGSELLTWERTVLTDAYRIQYSEDPGFKKEVESETAARNLLSLRGLVVGKTYYWRVQAISKGHASLWSAPFKFTVTP